MDRRAFLKTLGIGGGAIAFAASHPWIFPDTVKLYDGPFSWEWFASELTATVAAKLNGLRLRNDLGVNQIQKDFRQLSCSFMLASHEIATLGLEKIRNERLIPTAEKMADEILIMKPKVSGTLLLPRAIELAHSVTDNTSGLNLRFMRAYDIVSDRFMNRSDVLVA